MTLQQQVCSLELAKRLKELGVKQESYFSWYESMPSIWKLGDQADVGNYAISIGSSTAPQWSECSAFTVAELGEILKGWDVESGFSNQWMRWTCSADGDTHFGDTEADARASVCISKLEKGWRPCYQS